MLFLFWLSSQITAHRDHIPVMRVSYTLVSLPCVLGQHACSRICFLLGAVFPKTLYHNDDMAYNMTLLILRCTVPFPEDGLVCPVCNHHQCDSSSFKIHTLKVHKTLDAQTPTTCCECSREFRTFRAASAHFAHTHLVKKPSTTTTPPSPTVETYCGN